MAGTWAAARVRVRIRGTVGVRVGVRVKVMSMTLRYMTSSSAMTVFNLCVEYAYG